MPQHIAPGAFGLHYRTVLEEVDARTLALVIDRKSRLIMADGRKIIEKAQKIRQVRPDTRVIVKTSAPVCGKTRSFLSDQGISVLPLHAEP